MKFIFLIFFALYLFSMSLFSQVTKNSDMPQGNVSLLIQSNDPICAGQNLVLTAYGIQDKTCVILWTGPAGQSGSGKNLVISPAGSDCQGWWHMEAICDGYSLKDQILVTVYPFVIGTITPDSLVLCEGESALVTANPPSMQYYWSNGERTRSIKVNKSGEYSCLVSAYGACEDSTPVCRVTVLPKPIPQIVPNGPTSFCIGDSVVLEAFPKEDIAFYQWSTGDMNPTITVKETGTYKLTTMHNNGCKAEASIDVYAGGLYVRIGGDTLKCEGDFAVLEALPPEDDFEYLWSTGETSRSITVYKSGLYIVEATNLKGCKGSYSHQLTFIPPPIVKIKPLGPTEFCKGGSVKLTMENFDPKLIYKWSNESNEPENIVGESGMYYLEAIDSIGCRGIDSIEITEYPLPEVELITLGNLKHCSGDTIIIGTDKPFSKYLWNTGETVRYITVKQSSSFEITVTDSNGCTARAAIDVIIKPKPKVRIVADGPSDFCKGGSVTLKANDISGDIISFNWSNGETTPAIVVTESGVYKVIAENSAGCSDSASFEVEVYPLPEFEIIGSPKFCPGETIILSPNNDFAEYHWSNGANDKFIEVSNPGNYKLDVVDENGCKGVDEIAIDTFDINLSFPELYDFGAICVGDTKETDINLINIGSDNLTINNVSLAGNPEFTIASFTLPFELTPGESVRLKVKFAPTDIEKFNAQISIDLSEPCIKSYTLKLIGDGAPVINLWIPDTTAITGTKDFCIPIYGKLAFQTMKSLNVDYNISVEFDANAFITTDFSPSTPGKKLFNSSGSTVLNSESNIVTEMCGTVLLDEVTSSALSIVDYNWNLVENCTEKQNGSLVRGKICVDYLRFVKIFKPSSFEVIDNNQDGKLELVATGDEQGNFSIEIYTLQGILFEKFDWSASGYYEKRIELEYNKFSSGLYFVMFKSPNGIKTKTAVISK